MGKITTIFSDINATIYMSRSVNLIHILVTPCPMFVGQDVAKFHNSQIPIWKNCILINDKKIILCRKFARFTMKVDHIVFSIHGPIQQIRFCTDSTIFAQTISFHYMICVMEICVLSTMVSVFIISRKLCTPALVF